MAATLLPILQCWQGNAIGFGESLLRHVQASPDGAHVRRLNNVHARVCILAAGMRQGVCQAFYRRRCRVFKPRDDSALARGDGDPEADDLGYAIMIASLSKTYALSGDSAGSDADILQPGFYTPARTDAA